MKGYGRENEMEADRLGLEVHDQGRLQPRGHRRRVQDLQGAGETSSSTARQGEGASRSIYHGVFSDHPAPDERAVQAAGRGEHHRAARRRLDRNRDAYLNAIDGLPYGSSRAQGIVRDNRFYHADMGITMAFPRGWTIENQRDRLLAYTQEQRLRSCRSPSRSGRRSRRRANSCSRSSRAPRSSRARRLDGQRHEGYALVTRRLTPRYGAGPVRWAVLYRDKSAFIFGGREPLRASAGPGMTACSCSVADPA